MEPVSARRATSGEAGPAHEAVAGFAAFPCALTQFRLSEGGLLHGLLVRLRLASRGEDPKDDPVWRRAVALAAVAWVPLAALSVLAGGLAGASVAHAFLHDFVPHVRYLVSLPLLVIADALVDPMRRAPLDPGELAVQAVLLALPFGLLVLTEVPFAEVLKRLLDSLL